MQYVADSRHGTWLRAGYRVSGGRTGRSPCLTPSPNLVMSLLSIPGTAGPRRHLHFLDSTHPLGLGRRYRFKLSARLAACRALPRLTTRSPDGSGALAPSRRGTPCGMRYRSHPVEHGFRSFPAANRPGLSPDFQKVRNMGNFCPTSVSCSHRHAGQPRQAWDKAAELLL